MSVTGFAFYIAVRCGFDKHLYVTSCLNAHNHNTCMYVCPKQVVLRENWHFFIIIEDRQTQQVLLLAGDAMATTIIIDYNS